MLTRCKRHRFVYGNYDQYYGYRLGEIERDPRLDALQGEWFTGKAVLDIGCNNGCFSISVGTQLDSIRFAMAIRLHTY